MRSRYVTFWGAATALGISVSLVAAVPASAAPPKPESRAAAVADLKASSDRTPTVTTDSSGAVTSVRTAPGHPIDRADGVRRGEKPEATARGLAKEHGAAFGLRNGDANLRTTATLPAAGGLQVVRFNQTVGNVPVLGADLVVTVRSDGETVSVGSTVTTATPPTTTPRITRAQAADAARAATLRAEKLAKNATLTVPTPELAMFDPAVFGGPAGPGMRPVWRTKVTGDVRSGPVAADVLVDALTGRVVLYADALHTAKSRQVCDHGMNPVPLPRGRSEVGYYCPKDQPIGNAVHAGTVAAVEGDLPAAAEADVKDAYNYAGMTYDFFKTMFNRDSIDDQGMQIRSSVRYCPPYDDGVNCFANAYWDGEQMVYGPGFPAADDVVAHELTHGITEHTANLYYWYQSGAINESMSDIFGEFVDLTDGVDGAAAQTPWDIGEDSPLRTLRSMETPTAYGDPDRMRSPLYSGTSYDNGGVHLNSGVGNRAAYLIATGLAAVPGTTDGQGISKAAHLYYETLKKLPSGADYAQLAAELKTACTTLSGQTRPAVKVTGADPATVTFAAADCTVVDNAIAATEMTLQPTDATASAPEAAFCPDGSAPTTVFSDDMENTASGNWYRSAPATPRSRDASAGYFDPALHGSSYAHSGKVSLWALSSGSGNTSAASKLGRIQTTTAIPIPAGKQTFLWFAHSDDLSDGLSDVARVSAAVGSSVTNLGRVVGGTAPENGYRTGDAFVGDSHGYVSSRFDLTPFAGQSVKPTFDIVGDSTYESAWWLDDVTVYTCDGVAPSPVKTFAVTPAATDTATVSWTAPEWAGTSGLRDYSVDVSPAVAGFPTVGVTGTSVPVAGLDPAQSYTFTVTAHAVDGTAGTASTASVLRTQTSFTRSPATLVYGQRVGLSGTVTQVGTGTRLGGVTVLVQGRPYGGSSWYTMATVRSVSTGAWYAAHVPNRHYQYRAVPQAGTAGHAAQGVWAGPATAAALAKVAWRVSGSLRYSTIKRGQSLSMSAAVAPGRVATVELQRRVGSRWVVVQTKRTTSKGTAILTARHTKAGVFSYRVVARGDAQLLVAGSSARSLRVR